MGSDVSTNKHPNDNAIRLNRNLEDILPPIVHKGINEMMLHEVFISMNHIATFVTILSINIVCRN